MCSPPVGYRYARVVGRQRALCIVMLTLLLLLRTSLKLTRVSLSPLLDRYGDPFSVGVGLNSKDVTATVARHVRQNELHFEGEEDRGLYNRLFGDPAPNFAKVLTVKYRACPAPQYKKNVLR